MKIEIILKCPVCSGIKIKKINGKQNYYCNDCGRQFIGNHALSYKGVNAVRTNAEANSICHHGI